MFLTSKNRACQEFTFCKWKNTFKVKTTCSFPRVHVDIAGVPAASQAGAVMLTETIRATSLEHELSQALPLWRKPSSVHDPGKIITDLAVAVAFGGDCLTDLAVVRAEPGRRSPAGDRTSPRPGGAGSVPGT